MPVIVRELVIKAVVSGEGKESPQKTDRKAASRKSVEAGLEELARLIKEKNER
jgi:hypothetical protein